jgi:hypothetical protein
MNAPIFISFAAKDHEIARTVCEALENRGLNCWISSRDISQGENLEASVGRAVHAAKAMVLVLSSNANDFDDVRRDLILAGKSRLSVIPLLVEDLIPGEVVDREFAARPCSN